MQWLDTETKWMTRGTTIDAKSARDASHWALSISPTVPAIATSKTCVRTTTAVGGSANALSMNTTNHVTANSADIFVMKAGAARCTTCVAIFQANAGETATIEVLSVPRNVRGYAAATS